jgi:hypothetical protein
MCIFTMPLPYVGPANAVPNAVLYTMDSSSTKSGKLCARLVVLFISILHAMEESWSWTRTSRLSIPASVLEQFNMLEAGDRWESQGRHFYTLLSAYNCLKPYYTFAKGTGY